MFISFLSLSLSFSLSYTHSLTLAPLSFHSLSLFLTYCAIYRIEDDAAIQYNFSTPTQWVFINPAMKNKWGYARGYKIHIVNPVRLPDTCSCTQTHARAYTQR